MRKETPNYEEVARLLQKRTDRLQADRQLRRIMETGGIVSFISDEIARAVAPLIQIIALQQQALDTHQAEIAQLEATVASSYKIQEFHPTVPPNDRD